MSILHRRGMVRERGRAELQGPATAAATPPPRQPKPRGKGASKPKPRQPKPRGGRR